MVKWLWLVCAIFLICVAHYIRILRWELFISIYEKPLRQRLTQSLAIGYLLNYIVPYKLGDAVRAWYAGKGMKNGKALGFATVAVDRYLDIVAVGIIFAALTISRTGGQAVSSAATFYMLLALCITLFTGVCVSLKGHIKQMIRMAARVFNERIELSILRFCWALIWSFKNIIIKISKWKLAFYTILMWSGYLLSYFSFSRFLISLKKGVMWLDVFTMLFAENSVGSSTQSATTVVGIYSIIYMLAPLAIMLLLSILYPEQADDGQFSRIRLLPHLDEKEGREFLELYFSDRHRDYIANYLKINRNVAIIRDYSAGSNATTMLCMDGNSTFFRKYAFGADGDKLYEQTLWLERYQKDLPLPSILKREHTELFCYYDMPYQGNAVNLFEYIHSMPIHMGWEIIRRALERMERTIYREELRNAEDDTIHRYIESKVIKNLERIKEKRAVRALAQYDTLFINGVAYKNLSYYEHYLTEDYLKQVFKIDQYAVIHGDLTIENIICVRDQAGNDEYYIIDPNTGNIHESPNLDYGKLLQSIHGGYEFLMATKNVTVTENKIDFLFTKSSAYQELHRLLDEYMMRNLGEERTRSIYFHEIIHWLRLMPYKLEKDEQRAMLFYAGMLMVLHDVIERYGEERK